VNDQSEAARGSASSHWFGLDRLRLTEDDKAIEITIGTERHWDRSHLRRLRQSGDLPGMVPIIDSDFSADGKPFAVTPVINEANLTTLIQSGELGWESGAGIAEAAARAAHEAHLRGLFHGALSTDDVYLIGEDVAIAGVGLGLGGVPPAERAAWVAPEVREGAEPTERSDVYSLGKILESSLGSSLDTVPRSIRRLIMWSSSDTPEARPPSAMEFASILAEGLGEDRTTYGPAFIPTAEHTDLVSRASSAVSNHTPSPTAQATASAAGSGLGGAGLAAATSAFLAEGDTGAAPDDLIETQDADFDPGVELDSGIDAGEPDAHETAATTGDSDGDDQAHALLASTDSTIDEEAAAPAAAETIELDETQGPRRRGNRAGIIVGIVLAVGLAGIIWGILGSSEDGDTASGSTTTSEAADSTDATSADSTTGADATTEATVTSTTEAPTTETTATRATEVEAASEDELATIAETGSAVDASQAVVQLVHGLPATEVDAYVDGEAAAVPGIGFSEGTIAELDLEPGDHSIALYATADSAPRSTDDRTDEPLAVSEVTIEAEPTSIIAHLDAEGAPAITTFAEDVTALEPGMGRLAVRNLMAGGEIDVSVDGEIVVTGLAPGDEQAVTVEAGTIELELLGADGDVIEGHAALQISDGELVSLSAIGTPSDGTASVMIQTYAGLSSAPVAVPTGNSGLLGDDDAQSALWIVYGLMVALVVSGGVIAIRRQRSMS
jgi:hypothetical protein